MKVLGNLDIVKKSDVNVPFGSLIQNETDTQEGTPVIDDVLNDILVNLYKILVLTNINPTNSSDNNLTQYQLVEAIKKLPNSMNDVERVLTVSGSTVSVDLDLSILPNKYFFFGKPTETFSPDSSWTLKYSDTILYFSNQGLTFNSSDELLIVLDNLGVRAYSLTSLLIPVQSEIYIGLGNPLSYNNSSTMYYQESGNFFKEDLIMHDLETIIRTELENSTIVVLDMFVINGNVLCFCSIPSSISYFLRYFSLSDLTVSNSMAISGLSFGNGVDYTPYVYVDGLHFFISNNANTEFSDYKLACYLLNFGSDIMTFISTTTYNNTLQKTNNIVIYGGYIYSYISGYLKKYSGSSSPITTYLPIVSGQLFSFNNSNYIGSLDMAKKILI